MVKHCFLHGKTLLLITPKVTSRKSRENEAENLSLYHIKRRQTPAGKSVTTYRLECGNYVKVAVMTSCKRQNLW